MGVKIQHYLTCEGGKGSDQVCQLAFKDPDACCFSMTLKNFPAEPTKEESKMLQLAIHSGAPIYENSTEYLCMSSKLLKEIKPAINSKDELKLLPEGDTNMYYKAYCSGASTLSQSLVVAGLIYTLNI